METSFGLQTGAELFANENWLALALEIIWWKEIPSLLSINLMQWGQRNFGERELSRSMTVIRIQFMWFDFEVYFVGGVND